MKPSKGASIYSKGGYDYISYSIYFGDKIWGVKSPYTLSGDLADKTSYKSRNTALRACITNSSCKGMCSFTSWWLIQLSF